MTRCIEFNRPFLRIPACKYALKSGKKKSLTRTASLGAWFCLEACNHHYLARSFESVGSVTDFVGNLLFLNIKFLSECVNHHQFCLIHVYIL